MINEIIDDQIQSIFFDISIKFILPKYRNLKDKDIMRKNNNDLVTSVDIIVEDELKKILSKILPHSLFVGEEHYSTTPKIIEFYKKKKFCWTIDPIDGTTNFVNGKDKFAIMLALSYSDKILQSWIYKPLTEEMCSAKLQVGTFIDKKKIIINKSISTQDSIGSISSKYWNQNVQI